MASVRQVGDPAVTGRGASGGPRRGWRRAAQILFWAALAFAVVMAVLPQPPHLPTDRFGDKFQHIAAFTTLALLGGLGFAMPLARLAERLSFLGAVIEVVQSIPALHRDCDIMDWIADTGAILIALVLVRLIDRRRGRT